MFFLQNFLVEYIDFFGRFNDVFFPTLTKTTCNVKQILQYNTTMSYTKHPTNNYVTFLIFFHNHSYFIYNTSSLYRKYNHLRWLNRVMQDHEARASDLNRKLIFSFFLLFSKSKQTRTKIYCSTVTSDIKAFSLKLKLLKHRHFLTSVWL